MSEHRRQFAFVRFQLSRNVPRYESVCGLLSVPLLVSGSVPTEGVNMPSIWYSIVLGMDTGSRWLELNVGLLKDKSVEFVGF
jgi:hypothetical protein